MYQDHCWDCTTSKTFNLPPAGYKYILTASIQVVGWCMWLSVGLVAELCCVLWENFYLT